MRPVPQRCGRRHRVCRVRRGVRWARGGSVAARVRDDTARGWLRAQRARARLPSTAARISGPAEQQPTQGLSRAACAPLAAGEALGQHARPSRSPRLSHRHTLRTQRSTSPGWSRSLHSVSTPPQPPCPPAPSPLTTASPACRMPSFTRPRHKQPPPPLLRAPPRPRSADGPRPVRLSAAASAAADCDSRPRAARPETRPAPSILEPPSRAGVASPTSNWNHTPSRGGGRPRRRAQGGGGAHPQAAVQGGWYGEAVD